MNAMREGAAELERVEHLQEEERQCQAEDNEH